ncbi:uncharacterized protein CMU_021240 [Cryptosporidium muris RN66]|uniref:Uncharacterized protein n=1 Tax=Cryptosporidium muris (strain RN66) TaxID=441375 RepID=B6AJH0_CRYMR|nr:uncharacterized protein CMU_021240 [Cryptosporidium muris RN66]EEA08361.1 hypothetical protein, conserved [Cryptosporidium muris RN66]|eukprot:XP_002142710.1 hypothetical protein [Cryptosporidium muris RN66]
MNEELSGSDIIYNLLDIDDKTKDILKLNRVYTIPQILLDNLHQKGLSKKQCSDIYKSCRSILRNLINIILTPNKYIHSDKSDLGFMTGTQLLRRARNNWNSSSSWNTSVLKAPIKLGEESLTNLFDGGFFYGEVIDLFGPNIHIIRRICHWIVANTMDGRSNNLYSYKSKQIVDKTLYIQTTSSGFDSIYIKKCFQKVFGELVNTQATQGTSELSDNTGVLLSNIHVTTIQNTNELIKLLYNIPIFNRRNNSRIRLVIIDSITSILGPHRFFQDKNIKQKSVRDIIQIIARILRYICHIEDMSIITISSLKPSKILDQNQNTLMLQKVSLPNDTVDKKFILSSYNKQMTPNIDHSWNTVPHNQILIQEIENFESRNRAYLDSCGINMLSLNNKKVLKWTVCKSNRIATGKYAIVAQSKIGLESSDLYII